MLGELISLLNDFNFVSIVFRILLALIVGGVLGTERGFRNRPAGFMTYLLVCLGSTMIMLTNQYIAILYSSSDPTRLAAQVVSGIGFLGAGTIVVTRNDEIRGLTTAAGLWLAAGLGLAIGIGFYSGAIIGFAFSVFALTALKRFDIYIKQHTKTMDIYLEYNDSFSLRALSEYAKKQSFELFDLQRGKIRTLNSDFGTLLFSLDLRRKLNHVDIIDELYTLSGVEYIKEIA